jgi:hypothetical protein
MNISTNLPEPTYRFKHLFLSLENTMKLVKDIMLFAKKTIDAITL